MQYHGFPSLMDNGVCIFPLSVEKKKFDNSLNQQPELMTQEGRLMAPPFVGGGFGAFGHASSFHNTFVRDVRKQAHDALLDAIHQNHIQFSSHRYIEIVPDRQSFRPQGMTPTAETWHRDMSPTELSHTNPFVKSNPGDVILGGWVNCNDNHSQTFVCIPGTHIQTSTGSGDTTGFQKEIEVDKKKQVKIEIPPGHAMFFIQDTIHCVNATKLPFDMRRVYISIRISSSTEPLIVDIRKRLSEGSVIPLKSGQIPPMYPKLWEVNWQDKLIDLSAKFTPIITKTREMKGKRLRNNENTPDEGTYPILPRYAPPIAPQEPYTEEEIMLHLPHLI